MKVTVAYNHPVVAGAEFFELAYRFVGTYLQYPADYEHDLVVICSGSNPPLETKSLFWQLPVPCRFFVTDNVGWDIGNYQKFAKACDSDMLVCLGSSVHFHRRSWLLRFAQTWLKYGPGLYGGTASNCTRPHIQTTGFCCPPSLIRSYGTHVVSKVERYEFEHGPSSLTIRAIANKMPVMMVTWTGEYTMSNWRMPDNVFWKGDQSNCLYITNHMEHYNQADLNGRAQMFRIANG